jgi:hypothetical protein
MVPASVLLANPGHESRKRAFSIHVAPLSPVFTDDVASSNYPVFKGPANL